MFNIGVAGQYVAGACGCLYAALAWHLPWLPCLLIGMAAAALLGGISGWLKTACNVNVVISGIMLNWITLYLTNLILGTVKSPNSPYTMALQGVNPSALLPKMGLDTFFNNEKSVTIAIPLAVIMAIVVWVVLNKTKFSDLSGHKVVTCEKSNWFWHGMKPCRNGFQLSPEIFYVVFIDILIEASDMLSITFTSGHGPKDVLHADKCIILKRLVCEIFACICSKLLIISGEHRKPGIFLSICP
jgi:hypothetical protein